MNLDENPSSHAQNSSLLVNFNVLFLRMEVSHKSCKCLNLLVYLSTIYWFDSFLGIKKVEFSDFFSYE